MKLHHKSEAKISKLTLSSLPQHFKERSEREFILNFFDKLPIEDLKKLISFKEIDFEKTELWKDYENHEFLNQLRDENVIKYTCELYLDTDS